MLLVVVLQGRELLLQLGPVLRHGSHMSELDLDNAAFEMQRNDLQAARVLSAAVQPHGFGLRPPETQGSHSLKLYREDAAGE
mmetsp:Transcript_33835/g.77228  ORF Transcript_33835/g.77228 Transcript_33835/m.77228 type:complete len:82 (+) Transcript_33835:541-786(+)